MLPRTAQAILIGLLLTTLLGCSSHNEASPTPGHVPTPPDNWTIQLLRTGGFAGVDDTLTLDSTGELVFRSTANPQEIRSILPEGELARIRDLLEQAHPFTGPDRPSACRDCFNYTLDIQWDDQTHLIQMDDLNIPTRTAPLLEALVEILQAALAG